MLIDLPKFPIPGYTNVNVAGTQSQQAEVLAAQTLASGDVTLTAQQAASIGIIEVTTGHASNAFIVPANVGKMYWVVNNDGTLAASIKTPDESAVEVAAETAALVYVASSGACVVLIATYVPA